MVLGRIGTTRQIGTTSIAHIAQRRGSVAVNLGAARSVVDRASMRPRLLLVLLVALVARDTRAGRSLPDYRYFRALSIDLVGRPPTRYELAAFERPSFDLDGWIAMQLAGTGYA